MSREWSANLEIKSECPGLLISMQKWPVDESKKHLANLYRFNNLWPLIQAAKTTFLLVLTLTSVTIGLSSKISASYSFCLYFVMLVQGSTSAFLESQRIRRAKREIRKIGQRMLKTKKENQKDTTKTMEILGLGLILKHVS